MRDKTLEETDGRSVHDLYPNHIRFHNIEEITVRNDELKARLKSRAQIHYDAFNSTESQRFKEIELIVGELAAGPITISTFNEGFCELFRNWVASCDYQRIEIRDSALIFPIDSASNELAESMGFRTWFKAGAYGPVSTDAATSYGDTTFVQCMFAKNAVVQAMLPFRRDILFQDIDMVWNRDPRPWLEKRAEENQVDFQFMYDGYNERFQPLYYNSGFFYIRASPYSKAAWQIVFDNYDKVLHYRSQQVPVNIIMNTLRERGLKTERLAEELFVNGHATPIEPHKFAPEIADNGYVIHCSWTLNLEKKIEKLKQYKLWFLDQESD